MFEIIGKKYVEQKVKENGRVKIGNKKSLMEKKT